MAPFSHSLKLIHFFTSIEFTFYFPLKICQTIFSFHHLSNTTRSQITTILDEIEQEQIQNIP
jgi:hypothetical protein